MLHVAQPALGLQIRQLEEGLGTPLLERHSRGVTVTPAGKLLYDRACKILQLIEEAETDVAALGRETRETLSLGVTPSIMRLVGSEILVAAERDIPGVFLSLVEEPSFVLAAGIERGEIDLALTFEGDDRPGLRCKPLLVEELLLVTRPELAPAAEAVPFRDAVAMKLVLVHERDNIRRMIEAEARRQGVPVKVAYEVQSLQATQQVVVEGLAASILPFGTVAGELKNGELVSRRIEQPRLRRCLYLARAASGGHFANEDGILAFVDWVVGRLRDNLGTLTEPVATAEEAF